MNRKNRVTKYKNGGSHYIQDNLGGIPAKISWHARKKMFASLMRLAQPTAATTVLDVGVTSDQRLDSNFFEKLYPYPNQITALGLEDASFLERDHPGLKYFKATGLSLPLPDKSFDLVVSFAVIEHIGSFSKQEVFVNELFRVGKTVFITTPNRWYPIEFHSILPLFHWLPPYWFRTILRSLENDFFSKEKNLNLLGEKKTLIIISNNY